ncbi:hypothetical protein [Agromyces larvae]|uniref:Uncharacterized protein n=1 Tax=Agromyces larvae TaxID=2929802 RepID=A0ABY4BV59_9MICO|nr:hypothetical protein [Agromyces larvae]UOE43102.1 hypothetical protein MTO99_12995 [Agromyces larvae]
MNAFEPTARDYDELGRDLMARVGRVTRRARHIRRAVVIGAVGAISASVMGAAWVVLANPVMRETAAKCYEAADTTAPFITVVGGEATDGNGQPQPTSTDPVEMCAAAWRIGAIGLKSSAPPAGKPNHEVPDLVPCLQNDGVTAVFPARADNTSEELCSWLGLTVAPID